MSTFGYYESNAWYKLESNLQRIRRELVRLLESSEANECFVCNKLTCCCPEPSSRSSTLSCLTSIATKSCHSNDSVLSTNSSDETPVAPPAYSLPKPEWKAKCVADWIRASTSTPYNDTSRDSSKNFFYINETDLELTEDILKHHVSLQQFDLRKPYNHSLNYLSKSVPNVKDQYINRIAKRKIEVAQSKMGRHIIIGNLDELTKLDDVDKWQMSGQRAQNTVQAFFRSFGSTSKQKNPKGYAYF